MSATPENSRPGESSDDRLARIEQMLSGSFLFDDVRRKMVEQQARPLRDHFAEYRAHLTAKAGGAKHIKDTTHRLRRVLRLSRAAYWRQLSPAIVQLAVDKLRHVRAGRKTLGLATINHHIHSLKGFCNWFISDYRADRSPCLSLRPYNARLDVRRARRPLSLEEAMRLITAARNGPAICGISGYERAMMYELAWTTGLRAAELESLTRTSFDLSKQPDVIVEAAYSKHRRRDVVPIPAVVVPDVHDYLATCGRDAKLFRRPGNGNGTYALRKDLASAGIPYCLKGRYVDFHALRHTYITNLFEAGAKPKEAQTLARHQDARMTLAIYAHATDQGLRAVVERLPALHRGTGGQLGDEAMRI